jgi:DNA-binding transcriptional regulator YiaG
MLDVKTLRRLTGIRQKNMAAMIGVTPFTLRKWENGYGEASIMYRMILASAADQPDPKEYLITLAKEARVE